MSRNKYPEQTVNLIIDVSLKLFLEKGYENTSIQDIIDNLGGLSKGAIYHHFKSKEDILVAVHDKLANESALAFARLRDNENLNGFEKMKKMFDVSLSNLNENPISKIAPTVMDNSKFLVTQIKEIFDIIAPRYVQPVIEQGVRDGSIKTDYPKEMSEVILLMSNLWLNPIFAKSESEDMIKRVRYYGLILKSMGLDVLTEEMINQYIIYIESYCGER